MGSTFLYHKSYGNYLYGKQDLFAVVIALHHLISSEDFKIFKSSLTKSILPSIAGGLDFSFDAIQQEMQNELNYINELELEQELHPIADDDFQPEDEHPDRTLLKRDIHAIALKRMEDASPLDIIIPAPINHTYWRQIMKCDFIDVIFNCPFEMHESITDEGYSQIIHELKDGT